MVKKTIKRVNMCDFLAQIDLLKSLRGRASFCGKTHMGRPTGGATGPREMLKLQDRSSCPEKNYCFLMDVWK